MLLFGPFLDLIQNSMDARPKAPVIRADPTQAALLKAAFTVSYTPSSQAMRELSVQTGLPQKWISAWFGRQRTKAKKAIEVIDMTIPGSSTVKTRQENIKVIKEEHEDSTSILDSEPPTSSSPLPVAQNNAENFSGKPTRKPAKGTRKPKPKKNHGQVSIKPEPQNTQFPRLPVVDVPPLGTGQPHLLPSVLGINTRNATTSLQSRLPIPAPPTRSKAGLNEEQKPKEPKPKGSSEVTTSSRQTRSSRTTNTRSNLVTSSNRSELVSRVVGFVPDNGPALQGNHERNQLVSTLTDFDNNLGTPFGSERKPSRMDGMIVTSPETTHFSRTYTSQYPQHTKIEKSSYSPYPTAGNDSRLCDDTIPYQTVTVNSAKLFLTTQHMPTQLDDMNSLGFEHDIATSQINTQRNTNVDGQTDYVGYNDFGNTWTGTYFDTMHDIYDQGYYMQTSKTGTEDTIWNTTSDYVDLSHLGDDGAFSHLEERLKPFRLDESRYLFGRCGMMDCLLDEKLGAEEPFQAAMGLVLLSRLGLEW